MSSPTRRRGTQSRRGVRRQPVHRSPEVLGRRLAVLTVGVVIACLVIVLAAPPEATVVGATGLTTGFGFLLLAIAFAAAARRVRARGGTGGRRWLWPWPTSTAGWGLLAVCATLAGGSVVVGNFRAIRADLTVAEKQVDVGNSRTADEYLLTAATGGRPRKVSRRAYDAVRVGDVVRCTGSDLLLMGKVLTRCDVVRPAPPAKPAYSPEFATP